MVSILLAGILKAGVVATVNWGLAVGDAILVTPISSALSIVTISVAVFFKRKNHSSSNQWDDIRQKKGLS
ncbi:MAG: hypothetical protein GYA34_11815 [Chloroflexi bacterium]|nr:hypothetical protein [Chloroflexota bacterium]